MVRGLKEEERPDYNRIQRPTRANKFQGKFCHTKKYKYIPDEDRERLIHLVHTEGETIKKAAEMCNIPYENAKVINKVFVDEGRTLKMRRTGQT